MGDVAAIAQPDTSLEQRFGNYAEQAHPESMPPKEPEQAAPAEPTPAEPAPESAVEAPVEEAPVRFQFDSVDDLAKQLEVPVDAILALQMETEVDGQKGKFSLADIRKGFQLDQHNTNKSKELSAAQQKADAIRQQYESYQTTAKQVLDNAQALGKYAQDMLNAEFQNVNWQQLQVNDPIGYITTRQNFQDRQTQINNYLSQVNQQTQAQQAQVQTRQQAQMAEVIANRASIKPEWADEGTFRKDTETIRDTFLARGFKAEELPTLLTNPAYLAAADAATRWWNLQKQKPEVTQRVKTAPKLVSGAARIGTVQPSKMTNLKAQLRANPRDLDTAAAAFTAWAQDADKAGM